MTQNGYTSERWASYWSSPPSLILDIWAAHGQSAQMSKIKDSGLDQYGAQRSEVYLVLRRLCKWQTDSTVVPEVQQLLCFSVALVRHCDSDSCNNVWWSSLLLWILVTCNVSFYISSSRFNPSKVRSLALALKVESLALRVKPLLTSLHAGSKRLTQNYLLHSSSLQFWVSNYGAHSSKTLGSLTTMQTLTNGTTCMCRCVNRPIKILQ